MKLISAIVFAALVLCAPLASADALQGLQTRQQFETLRTQVSKGMADHDDKFREISADDQKKLAETLDRMEQRWQSAVDGGTLSQAQQVEMMNDQEVVATILDKGAADSRVVCERVPKLGSNLPKSVCKTVGERRREMERAQQAAQGGALESN
ncbi:MAG: hypothetical protein JSS45_06840 [Proteobacteria bacterium]|nr:hypothetical protein [Pseudomonadota bacterium]